MSCPVVRDYVFSEHARWEMERRGISKNQVDQVLGEPEQMQEDRPGRCVYQSRLPFGVSLYLVRVFVDIDRFPAEVVTVYRTSQIRKYWR